MSRRSALLRFLPRRAIAPDEPVHAPGDDVQNHPLPGRPDLRSPGRILLLSCYELGHAPHGLTLPKAFLERAGFAPACIDISLDAGRGASDPGVDRDIVQAVMRAGLVCISVPMHTALRVGARLAEYIRTHNPDAKMCFFGPYAVLNADYLYELGADWMLAGESEQAVVELAERVAQGHTPRPFAQTVLARLDVPRVDRKGLPGPEHYARLDTGTGELRLTGYTETSRGCLDVCRHCPIPAVYSGRFFVIDARVVLDDIAAQVALGARHITFGDPDFFNGPGHGMAILRAGHERWPDLTFDITAQISHLQKHRRYLPELSELGCAFVVSAVESLSDRVLSALQKRHRRGDVEQVLDLCRKAGLTLRPTFVTFTPWTTLADVCELVDFIESEGLVYHVDPIQLAVRLLVPPGSLLLSAAEGRAAFGPLDKVALTHEWSHPDPRVDALYDEFTRIVTDAAQSASDPAGVIESLRERAYRAAGRQIRPQPPRPRKKVPRLTEPWFC
ncbi:MAG: CUAEP/CCAEP-tail radical SAM protein [Proteobacteria bacterium]|nr:CUAEP/CCAEP-tail radical SAM protein [Pseudomonadota bacterium]